MADGAPMSKRVEDAVPRESARRPASGLTRTWRLFARFAVNRRFWKQVDVRAPDECWSWQGTVGPDGVPEFDGRPAAARAYELARGPVPDRAWLRQLCGNPRCMNPDHLELQS
jgi:hypothetical protein